MSGIIIKEFGALRPKMYSYSPDDVHVDKTAKYTKNCVIKQEIKFQDKKTCLENNRNILSSRQRLRSEIYIVFTEKINKIAWSVNNDKRIKNLME